MLPPPFALTYRSDKDASGWSKDKLKSLLVGVTVEGREGEVGQGMEFGSFCSGDPVGNRSCGGGEGEQAVHCW